MTELHPDILAQVIRRIGESTPPALRWKIGAQAGLKADLGFDGLDRLTLACALDEDFAIEIEDAAIPAWETVADVVATIDRLCSRSRHPHPAHLGSSSAADAERNT